MKIILNADDFGLTHEANLGIAKAFDEGFCSQASVVTNTNYFDEAVSLAEKNNFKHKVVRWDPVNLRDQETETICQIRSV